MFESISKGRSGRDIEVFTGIVEAVGTISNVSDNEYGRRLGLSVQGWAPVPVGASIAVNGVCLTALECEAGIEVDVIPETLSRTNLGALGQGEHVNLERAMRADGRFDGHIVQGHIDGTGMVRSLVRDEDGVVMGIEADESLLAYVVEKGSITVDGVSLTVAALNDRAFSVALIPHTLDVTTLGLRSAGDLVNLEVDILSKYVERLLRVRE